MSSKAYLHKLGNSVYIPGAIELKQVKPVLRKTVSVKGQCPAGCGKQRLRKNGTLYSHRKNNYEFCQFTGKEPDRIIYLCTGCNKLMISYCKSTKALGRTVLTGLTTRHRKKDSEYYCTYSNVEYRYFTGDAILAYNVNGFWIRG